MEAGPRDLRVTSYPADKETQLRLSEQTVPCMEVQASQLWAPCKTQEDFTCREREWTQGGLAPGQSQGDPCQPLVGRGIFKMHARW